ncbi:SDR family oxidoreductase [Pseudomonas panipatensis]|uniref:3-oxoacyl-[acyl-carrier protein] reductase n=1 Tax=Pseudomonas panipatensis TaxID=428992 RepID=A0A1G8JCX4_9PSED|nr:SDR family oxidoreductase [Pseudomonas panipatensis]SDI28941.1 3-oxoacyl-[acyl-carrier protein] reductase [Pseudomonas panipatensis]SMP50881.1 glucose 1-dehydrogenase [Pseudomonas panipatensis]
MNESRKIALVTGSSRGIGHAVAKRLAADGFAIAVHYAGSRDDAEQLVAAIRLAGGQAHSFQADIAAAEQVQGLFAAVSAAFGRLDVVVHCAGVMDNFPIASEHLARFDRLIATNLRGSYLVMAEAARLLGEGGRIILFSTSVIAKSFPNYGAYIAAKAGVEGLVPVLANEVRGRGITVNAVAPGPVATELFLHGKTPEQVEQIARMAPLERLGTPDDIAGVVAFLAGPDGAWVNAQVLRANGGFA